MSLKIIIIISRAIRHLVITVKSAFRWKCFLLFFNLPFLLILTSYHSLDDTKKILNIISSISDEGDMVSDQMGLYKGPRGGVFFFSALQNMGPKRPFYSYGLSLLAFEWTNLVPRLWVNEAVVDLLLMKTSFLFFWKLCLTNTVYL